jgi:hypothetical protein
VITTDLDGEGVFTLEKLVDGTYINEEKNYKKHGSYVTCKSTNVNFWNTTFYSILGFGFIFPFVSVLFLAIISLDSLEIVESTTVKDSLFAKIYVVFVLGMFLLFGILLLYFGYGNALKNIKVETLGVATTGKICSRGETTTKYNGARGSVYTIMINTPEGGKFIKYDMHGPEAPYKNGDTVNVKVYQNYVSISKRVDVEKINS